MDLKKTKEEYGNYTISQKQDLVLAMLKGFAGKGEIFDTLFEYISNNEQYVTEPELDEIFQIILVALYQDGQDKFKEASERLDMVKQRMIQMRQQEEQERKQNDPEEVLTALI